MNRHELNFKVLGTVLVIFWLSFALERGAAAPSSLEIGPFKLEIGRARVINSDDLVTRQDLCAVGQQSFCAPAPSPSPSPSPVPSPVPSPSTSPSPTPIPTPSPSPSRYAISGTVTFLADNSPASFTTVRLTDSTRVIDQQTDRAGRFSFTGLAAGRYQLAINQPGYSSTIYDVINARGDLTLNLAICVTEFCGRGRTITIP